MSWIINKMIVTSEREEVAMEGEEINMKAEE